MDINPAQVSEQPTQQDRRQQGLLWPAFRLTVEMEQGFGSDWRWCEHQHFQAFQALSANLCRHLLVDLAHMIQLEHLQAHAVPRWVEGRESKCRDGEDKKGLLWIKDTVALVLRCFSTCIISRNV